MISTQTGDKAWKQAKKIVNFPEYKYTCIGYGSDSINGSGSGANLNDKIFQSAKEIVDKAKNDPSIFLLLPLLEEGIGADRISDMAQGIIDNEICKYTAKIMNELEIIGNTRYQTKPHSFAGEPQTYNLLKNPYTECVIKLLPSDVLSSLPLADTFDSWAVDVIETNAKLRDDINRHFGVEWHGATKKHKKQDLMERIKNDKEFFLEMLKALKEASFEHYDIEKDVEGLHRWLKDSEKLIPLGSLDIPEVEDTLESITLAVQNIITHFKEAIENTELWRIFWTKSNGKTRFVKEFYSQMLFYVVCEAWLTSQSSNLKLTRELNHTIKQIDFKFTISRKNTVCVQVKHANGNGIFDGYDKQVLLLN